jgi:hypothetical protein
MIIESFTKNSNSKRPSVTCPISKGNFTISNWEFTDEALPRLMRRTTQFTADMKFFTKLINVPNRTPFCNYHLEGETKF